MPSNSLGTRTAGAVAVLLGRRLSPLDRLRRLFLLFGHVNLSVATVLVLANPHATPGSRLVGIGGLAVMCASWWLGRRAGARSMIWLVDAGAVLLVGVSVPNAAHVNGLVWSGIFLRSLYGSIGLVALHVLGRVAAFVTAVVVTAGWSGVLTSAFAPQLVVMPIMAGLLYVTKTSLLRYEEGRDRDRVLLDASTALVAATGPAAAAEVARKAAAAIVGDPVARIAILAGPPDALVPLAGELTVADVPAPALAALADGRSAEERTGAFHGVVLAVPLLVQGRPGGGLVVRSARPVPAPRAETLASLANAVALAMESWSLAEDLNARRGEGRFGALVQFTSDAIVVLNRYGTVAYQTPSAQALFGYPAGELAGTSWVSLLHEDDVPQFLAVYRDAQSGVAGTVRQRLRVRRRDGSWRHVEVTASNLLDDPQVNGVVLVHHDITDRLELEEQLSHQSFHDPLTGLANRALFLDRLGHALARTARSTSTVAMLLVDLDDFKSINDSLGHGLADRLLAEVATRLLTLTRAADTVARLGGDEFALLIEGGEAEAIGVADRLTDLLHTPFRVVDQEVAVTAGIGIVVAEPGDQVEQLLSNADLAMYQAKAGGRGGNERYRPALRRTMSERADLTVDLRRALERAELVPYYQPIVSLADERIVGAEALLRWQHPTRGLVSPATFIPLAEETGLIVPIGQWILDQATAQAAAWFAEHGRVLSISVNLSARQLQEADLAAQVAAALRGSGLPADALTLEITESLLVNDSAATVARLDGLKGLGVRLAIDDFGTGYSSLGYLRRFPVDVLKIDKCFVDDVAAPNEQSALSRSIVKLGRTLRLTTVAEGVEHADQVLELRRLGCDLAQGFHFARPMPAAEFDRTLRAAGTVPVRLSQD